MIWGTVETRVSARIRKRRWVMVEGGDLGPDLALAALILARDMMCIGTVNSRQKFSYLGRNEPVSK